MQEIVEIRDGVLSSLIKKYVARSNAGIEKYGTTLEENDKDDFLNHLQEELMDASLYVEKLKQQKRTEKLEQISESIVKTYIKELRQENTNLRKQVKNLKEKHKSNSHKAFKNYIKPIQYLQYAYKIGNEKYFSQAINKYT